MDRYKLASNSEQELIIKSLIELIKTFPFLPKSVKNIMFYRRQARKPTILIVWMKAW